MFDDAESAVTDEAKKLEGFEERRADGPVARHEFANDVGTRVVAMEF